MFAYKIIVENKLFSILKNFHDFKTQWKLFDVPLEV